MKEAPPQGRRREAPEEMESRIAREETELLAEIQEQKVSKKITDAEADEMIDLLAKKHNVERLRGVPFDSREEFDEYDIFAAGEAERFLPDLEKDLKQGKKYFFEGHSWVYMGINPDDGERIFRREGDGGGIEERIVNEEEIENLFNVESSADQALVPVVSQEAPHESATHEPPAEIVRVAVDAAPAGSGVARILPKDFDKISPEREKTNRLSEIKKEIDAQWVIIKANRKKDGDSEAKKAAEEKIDDLHREAKGIALGIVDGVALLGLVKPADAEAIKFYKSKISEKKKLSREERKGMEALLPEGAADAYYEAGRRRNDFVELLVRGSVEKDAAAELYQEWLARAGYAVWLRGELEGGKTEREKASILDDTYAIKALEWEGIGAEEPKAVLAELASIVDGYNAIPPKEERPKRTPTEKVEKTAPLHERVLSGEVDITGVPEEHLNKLASNKNEKVQEIAKAEIVRREEEEKQAAVTAEKPPSLRGRFIEAVKVYKEGDHAPPEKLLRKYIDEPDVVEFLLQHPEFKPGATSAKEDEGALTPFPITIAPGDRGVLIFHTWRDKIPDGVQLGSAGGGGAQAVVEEAGEEESSASETLKNVRLGTDSFVERCSMAVVNVTEDANGHCRVYVNFDTDKAHPGWNEWGKEGNAYGPLLRSLFDEKYKSVKVSREGKKVSLQFSDKRTKKPAETKIVFVAEKNDAPNLPPKTDAELSPLERRKGFIGSLANYTEGDTVPPENLLRTYAHAPEVVAFLTAHPEFTPKNENASPAIAGGRETQPRELTALAKAFLGSVDSGGVPAFIGASFKKILAENGISYRTNMTPNEAVEELRKIDQYFKDYQIATKARADQKAFDDGIPTLTDVVEEGDGIPVLMDIVDEGDGIPTLTEVAFEHSVAKQFEEKFGIQEADLRAIEGFSELSPGQQLLVLKNLEQIALTDIKREARTQQKDEWAKTPALRRIWKQIYSFGMNPEHRIAELEKEILAKQRDGMSGDPAREKILAEHLANLEQLAKVAAEGPDVVVKEGGEIEMLYVSEKDSIASSEDHALTPEEKKLFEEFNAVASEFAKFPREWGYETEEPGMVERWLSGDRRRYKAVSESYFKARANMLALYTEKLGEQGDPDYIKSTMLAMNRIDERIQLNQLFNNHPDAEKALEQVEDQNTIFAAAKEFWKSKGMFIAGGVLARFATIAISGGVMLPAIFGIGAGVGGLMGKAEGKMLMKAKRTDGRMEEVDLREEIEYGVITFSERIERANRELAKTDLTPAEREKFEFQLKDATERLAQEGEIPEEKRTQKRKIKEFTDATFFVDRVNRLYEKLSNTEDANEQALIEKKIAQTVALMHEKFERGMINFGGSSLEAGEERKGNTIANRLSFIQAMAQGTIETSIDLPALGAKIEEIAGLRQSTIEEKRKREIKKIVARSAVIRGTFALAGAGIAQGVKEIMHFGEPGYLGASDVSVTTGGAQVAVPSGATIKNVPPGFAVVEQVPDAPPHTDVSPDSENPEQFNPANYDKNIPSVIGRAPSSEELSALRKTGGVDVPAEANMDQHNALIIAMKGSQTPLSHEQIGAVLGGSEAVMAEELARMNIEVDKELARLREGSLPGAVSPVRGTLVNDWMEPGPTGSHATPSGALIEESPGSELPPYKVVSGDNFTKILGTHPALLGLSPWEQENVIQNLLKSLSQEERDAIGLGADPNKLVVGQTLDLNKVTELLHEKKIGGGDLLEHAKHPTVGAAPGGAPPQAGEVVGQSGVSATEGPPWESLDEIGKMIRAEHLSERYIAEGVNKLFIKSPFEEWPKEWLLSRNRSALELLNQTKETDPRTLLPGIKSVPVGYEWSVVEKIQKYMNEQGITREKGFIPQEKETVQDFLKRAWEEKIMRDGPHPEGAARLAIGVVV